MKLLYGFVGNVPITNLGCSVFFTFSLHKICPMMMLLLSSILNLFIEQTTSSKLYKILLKAIKFCELGNNSFLYVNKIQMRQLC